VVVGLAEYLATQQEHQVQIQFSELSLAMVVVVVGFTLMLV
jgi:hypothetical protein